MNWNEMRERFPWLPESSRRYYQHANGGGWVSGDSRVDGGSVVDGGSIVTGGSVVTGGSIVTSLSVVDGYSRVTGDSVVTGGSIVTGLSVVTGRSVVDGDSIVTGDSVVTGGSRVDGTPLCLHGLVPWRCCASGPGTLSIGCERHTLTDWRERIDTIANQHRVAQATVATIRDIVLPLFERWFMDNPNVITAAEAAGGNDEA